MPTVEEVRRLEEALKEAKQKLEEQDAYIEAVNTMPFKVGTILFVSKDTVFIGSSGADLTEVAKPKSTSDKKFPPLKPGMQVRVHPKLGTIVDVTVVPHLGALAPITNVFDDGVLEVNTMSGKKLVVNGIDEPVQVKDLVQIDASGNVAVRKAQPEDKTYAFMERTFITWREVGGLEEAKRELQDAIEAPFKHPDIYKYYNAPSPKGFLFHGTPGNGKTLLGKAVATAIAEIHKSKTPGFFYVKGPEVLSKWVGEAEGAIRQLFEAARAFRKREGFAPVLFIDEADALLSKRGSGISSDMEKTIVPMFLAEMDGLESEGAMVILATNRPDRLDEAVVREGRVDKKIKITRPDNRSAEDIFKVHLRKYPIAEDRGQLAREATKEIFAEGAYPFYKIKHSNGNEHHFGLSHVVSGAMIATIVQTAVSLAIRRNLEGTDSKARVKGVTQTDLRSATKQIYHNNFDVSHDMQIKDHLKEKGYDREHVTIHRQTAASITAVGV